MSIEHFAPSKNDYHRPLRDRDRYRHHGRRAALGTAAVHQVYKARTSGRIATLEEENARLRELTRRDRQLPTTLNKETFLADLDAKLEANKSHSIGLFFIDLNNFKTLNDTLGHTEGDNVLKLFADRLNELTRRSGDELLLVGDESMEQGRMGGDEFALSVVFGRQESHSQDRRSSSYEQMDNLYTQLKAIAESIREKYQASMPEGKLLGLSVGAALYDPTNNPVDAETLIRQADEAMYEEKPEKNSR